MYTSVFFTYNKTAEQNLITVRKEPRPVSALTFSLDKLRRVLGAEESSDRKDKVMMLCTFFCSLLQKNAHVYIIIIIN